ncbi:hypothetical protein H4R24_001639, partial [Coemansia sp. RSA 988]
DYTSNVEETSEEETSDYSSVEDYTSNVEETSEEETPGYSAIPPPVDSSAEENTTDYIASDVPEYTDGASAPGNGYQAVPVY